MEKETVLVCRKHCLDCNLEELQNRIDRVLEMLEGSDVMISNESNTGTLAKILRGESH